ncbi:MAG: flagellar assembly protein FliW [Lachnospirales bacterium]
MELVTKNFGTISYDENKVIDFPEGIPAFEEMKKFVILGEPDTDFFYLQSTEDGNLSFVLLDVQKLMPNYDPMVKEEQIFCLGEIKNNISIYNVCVIKDTLENMTVNLMAPIVINNDTNKGKQVILENNEYSIKHSLITE